MSWRCVNPSCYYGEPGDPPEFESDNSVECSNCNAEIDLDDDQYTGPDANGNYFCEDCENSLHDDGSDGEEEDDE